MISSRRLLKAFVSSLLTGGYSPALALTVSLLVKTACTLPYAYVVHRVCTYSEPELQKLAVAAPGARVFCRILVDCPGAEWPLSRKFGCHPDMAVSLLHQASLLGLEAFGLSFHVGSQQTNLSSWDTAVGQARRVFDQLEARGVQLKMLNLGGGFPAHYRARVQPLEVYVQILRIARPLSLVPYC